MANIASAKKRARQAEQRREHNKGYRTQASTFVKRVTKAIQAGDREQAEATYRKAVPVLDRVAGKGIISRNKAARHKSRLNQRIKQMSA